MKNLIYKSAILAFISHWTVQSIFYMDWTERFSKISLDIVLTTIFFVVFNIFLSGWLALASAFFIAHTLNFLFNSHVASTLKLFGLCKHSTDHLLQFGDKISIRLINSQAILCAAIWGGFARNEHSEVPDLDIFVVRRAGFLSGFLAIYNLLLIRSFSFLRCIPIDIYVLDSFESLSRLRGDEVPIILCDADGLLRQHYPEARYLKDY